MPSSVTHAIKEVLEDSLKEVINELNTIAGGRKKSTDLTKPIKQAISEALEEVIVTKRLQIESSDAENKTFCNLTEAIKAALKSAITETDILTIYNEFEGKQHRS